MAQVFSDDSVKRIRDESLAEGIEKLRGRIKSVEVDVPGQITEKKVVEPKYTKEDIANSMVKVYKDKVKPVRDTPYNEQLPTHDPIDRSKEREEANTIAKRANIRALSNSLANIRNGGWAGPTTEFTPSANGDVNPGRRCGYNALVVAGTEMTLEQYEEYIQGKFVKEDPGYDQNDDSHNAKGEKLPPRREKKDKREVKVRKKSDGGAVYTRESVLNDLKKQLLELKDSNWQSIDKVMRQLAKEHKMTPKELHKQFKSEEGMIPDEWLKENAIKEQCGYIPLDEVVTMNKVGNVYDVTLMWRAHTRRLKFFWPSVKAPTNDDMQREVEKFYPGGKLLAFYMSTEPGDNQINTMVVVPALKDSYNWTDESDWQVMSESSTAVYAHICADVGEPLGAPILNEEGNYELLVSDHDTGEEKVIAFTETDGFEGIGWQKSFTTNQNNKRWIV